MDGTVLACVLSFLGTLIGSLGGILASAKLTNYRLEQLEKRLINTIILPREFLF